MLPFNIVGDDDIAEPPHRPPPSAVEFLMALAFINTAAFAGWQALINNFAREQAGFGWFETGLTQSFRELPGLLVFSAVVWLLWMREQTLAYASLALLSFGVAMTGFFPTLGGIIATTLVMSFGFHYFEAATHSMQLQFLRGPNAARDMGRVHGASAAAQFISFGAIFVLTGWFGYKSYMPVFVLIGMAALVMTWLSWRHFPQYEGHVPQLKSLMFRRRYGLYYALTFMSGARRQIFVAFGAFLLVDRFGLPVDRIALLYLATAFASTMLAPRIGAMVGRIGERRTMILENLILIVIFSGYALTSSPVVAALLFVVDGVSTSLTIAQRTYIQKIGAPEDMSATTTVGFTFNHIAAVVIPVVFGALGQRDPAIIFWLGTAIAVVSLNLALLVPKTPAPGNEFSWWSAAPVPLPSRDQPAE